MGLFDIFKKKSKPQNTTTFQLNIQNDVLTDDQRENFVYSCLMKGIKLNREMVSGLSLGEILSVVFVTENCDLSTYPNTAKEIQEHNRGYMLSMAADWLKHNDFFVIEDASHNLIRMSNNGIIFTCVYSSLDLARKATNGCIGLTVQRINTNKPDFWKKLLSQGIVQVVADNSPVTLNAQGCLIYAMATIADSSDNRTETTNEAAVKCNFTVEQQREWLSVLSRTIPTIMIGGNPLCVDHHLHPRMLEEAGNMLNTVGRIAFEVSQTLSITNIEKALNTSSLDDLITSYYILREYSSMIKEPYCDALRQKNEYILSVIKKENPDFQRVDVVTSKRFDDTTPRSNTFVCSVCGKELPIKYRHNNNKCVNCAETHSSPSTPEYDFEMQISDVFYVDNRGVILEGTINKGNIHRGDTVWINGKEYIVLGIALNKTLVESAQKPDSVGLLINSHDKSLFHTGEFVFGNTASRTADEHKTRTSESVQKTDFCLGTFNFTEDDRQPLKAAALRYMPHALDTIEAQLYLLKILSLVMNISVVELKTEFSWKIPDAMPEEMKKERFTSALIETILSVNQTLGFQNPDSLIKKVDSANAEELLKSWIVLDYYAHTLKSEHTPNIQHFRDYIHNTIQTKFLKVNPENVGSPVRFDGTSIHIDSNAFLQWKNLNVLTPQYELNGILPLANKEPTIYLYEDGIKTREYVLQTENEEDFTGKYFHISVRLGIQGDPAVPVAQIDGFISDTSEERKMTMNDIGYRFEGHFLACGGDTAKLRREMNIGQDLPMKALKYQGYTTPSNIRLVGICPECGKSFCFHGYAFYMAQSDVAYSDDGLDCCEIQAYDIDKDTWTYETDGKIFRYYNSFNCPHCGTPYIDYTKHPDNKVFGVSGCVLLGRKQYQYK